MTIRRAGIAIIAVSNEGGRLGVRLCPSLDSATLYVLQRHAPAAPEATTFDSLSELTGRLFKEVEALIFVTPVGIAVRAIAPHLDTKSRDPAVVCLDDGARFAIALLSAHGGGANVLAQRVAALCGARPVVTTTLEARGLPVPELLGLPFGWRLEASREALLRCAAALANREPIGCYQTAGTADILETAVRVRRYRSLAGLRRGGLPGIAVTDEPLAADLAERLVVWRPRLVAAGMGCSTGAPEEELAELLLGACREVGVAVTALRCLATLDRKRQEPGLRRLSERYGLELRGYREETLAAQTVPNPSAVVAAAVGTPSVAEAAAILAADGAPLLLAKRASKHGTVALAGRRGGRQPGRRRTT